MPCIQEAEAAKKAKEKKEAEAKKKKVRKFVDTTRLFVYRLSPSSSMIASSSLHVHVCNAALVALTTNTTGRPGEGGGKEGSRS